MERDVGGAGEARFKELCSLVGITANGSKDKDRYGWDYYLEFPTPADTRKPIDERDSAIECKVQVKATDGKDQYQDIKVSVLHRLATTHKPAFFAFLEYNGSVLYNVPNEKFTTSYQDCVANILNWYRQDAAKTDLVCANEQYYLLRDGYHTCWSQTDCDALVEAAVDLWNQW